MYNNLTTKTTPVLCAFPGTGKTYLYEKYKDKLNILDSDSSKFSWLEPGVRNPDFPNNYIKHIKEEIDNGAQLILVSSHDIVRKALIENEIPFSMVYPHIEDKNVYLERYKNRGSDEVFIKMMDEKFEEFINGMIADGESNPDMIDSLMLSADEYISDRFVYVNYNGNNTDIADFKTIEECITALGGIGDYLHYIGCPDVAERINLICGKLAELTESLLDNIKQMQEKLEQLKDTSNRINIIQNAINDLSSAELCDGGDITSEENAHE